MSRHLVIAGAGIIGASIAWRAAQRGFHVTLVDAGSFAGEASWAGAGMLAPGGEFTVPGKWADAAVESLAMYPGFIRELEADSGRAIDFRVCGAIDLDATVAPAPGIRSERTTWRGEPARFYPDEAVVDPRDVTASLRLVLDRLGVAIREHEPVTAIETDGVVTSVHRYRASATVLAAGAWSSTIPAPHPLPKCYPVRGHLIGYAAPPRLLDPILRRGHTYLLQRASGLLIAGATSEDAGFDRAIDPGAAQSIASSARELLPELARLPEPHVWTGFRPGAAEPVVRRVDNSTLWLAYGHYRNGILLAPWTADAIVTSIVETV